METKVIKNCIVTGTDVMTSQIKQVNQSINIPATNVYSICPGVVTFIGRFDDVYTIVVQYSTNVCFQYKNIKSTTIKFGQYVDRCTLLGIANKYVQFTYLTLNANPYACRRGKTTFYKQDPINVLINGYADDFIYLDNVSQPIDTGITGAAPDWMLVSLPQAYRDGEANG